MAGRYPYVSTPSPVFISHPHLIPYKTVYERVSDLKTKQEYILKRIEELENVLTLLLSLHNNDATIPNSRMLEQIICLNPHLTGDSSMGKLACKMARIMFFSERHHLLKRG